MKGNVTAIPLILMVTLSLGIAVLIGWTVLDQIQENTTQDQIDQETLEKGKQAIGVFNLGLIVVNAGFYLASMAFVYRIRTNPIFALPSLLFLSVAVWLSAELANVYMIVAGVPIFQEAANTMSSMTLYFQNLPVATAVLGIMVAILLYGKTRRGEEITV